jgi:hypothetical protein
MRTNYATAFVNATIALASFRVGCGCERHASDDEQGSQSKKSSTHNSVAPEM